MYRKTLAYTLDIIAESGASDMYNGSLARLIVRDLNDTGKVIGRSTIVVRH